MLPTGKTLTEAPIIFEFKFPHVSGDVLPHQTDTTEPYTDLSPITDYNTILQTFSTQTTGGRFNATTMNQILQSTTQHITYGPLTVCFWCCHPFPWVPAVLPVSFAHLDNTYVCEGHYCSPECALAYLYGDVQLSDAGRWNRQSLLFDLYKDLYRTTPLNPAPHRHTLRMFGGPLDIDQFRQFVVHSEDLIALQLPPIRTIAPTISLQRPTREIKSYVSLTHSVVEKASKELLIRRNKPVVHTGGPTLDSYLLKSTSKE